MKRTTIIGALIVLFIFNQAEAQDKWKVEFRSAAAFATKNIGDVNPGTGIGFDGIVSYNFMPHTAAFAGWGWNHFSPSQSFAEQDLSFEETGYTFGLQFIHPFGSSDISYLVRAGGIIKHIEVENDNGKIINDSGHGLGWQVETGLVIPLNNNLRIQPTVRYQTLSRDIEVANKNISVDLNYLAVGVGLSLSL